jgi:uncharacterized protein (TIGR03067 family)
MKALFAITASLTFLVAASAQDNDAAVKKDVKLFTGTWQFESLETPDGKSGDLDGATLKFDGNKIEFKKGDETKKATYTINPAGNPKEIDLKADDKDMHGIYKFEKNILTMCICEATEARPNEFAAKNSHALITLKRAAK